MNTPIKGHETQPSENLRNKLRIILTDFKYGVDHVRKRRNRTLMFNLIFLIPSPEFGDLRIRVNGCRFRKNFDQRFTWVPPWRGRNLTEPIHVSPDLYKLVLNSLMRCPFARFIGPVGWEEEHRGTEYPINLIVVDPSAKDYDPALDLTLIPPEASELLSIYNNFSLDPDLAKQYTELGAPRPSAKQIT